VGGNWCASPFPHRYVSYLTCQLLCINVFATNRLVSTQQGGQHPPCCIENTFKTVCCSLPRLKRETKGLFVLHPPFSPPHFHALSTCCPPHPPSIETKPNWAHFRCSASVHHLPTRRASKKCPFGHVFDAWCLSTTSSPASIGKMPRWAWFRCSASVNCPEHRNCAHLGTFSMLGIYPPPPHPPSIEKVPRWARFRYSASIHHLPTRQASVHHPEHRNCTHLGTFSMLSARPPHPHPPNIEKMPRWAHFRCSGCPPLPHPPNIKTVPIWTRFRCSACVHHIPTRRT